MGKLKVGLIGGGGPGNFFGHVHKRAIALDNSRELVAGALRTDPEAALAAAADYDVIGYSSYQALLEAVQSGKQALDYVTIVTPNHAHYAPAKAFLEAGIPVLCEKPMTMTVAEAEDLKGIVDAGGTPFVLAHTYAGHPMMMFARELVQQGRIGEVRKVEAWYNQGWLATALEDEGLQQAEWRTDPSRTGISNCGGDIGTHAFIAATWVSGQSVKKVSARLNCFVDGRQLDDDFNVIGELSNGGTAIITATQIAIGYRNDNGFRVYGSKGSLEWHQERAESLLVRTGEVDETYWIGANYSFLPESVTSYLRVPSGHHEDFFEALANLHGSMERMIRRGRGEDVPEAYAHPGVDEGVAGMRFVKAAVDSSSAQGAWTEL
ncbi:MAG TPA: Gfo/Idh/MocA family oxidoreductase [Candidatus Latescibacteria bacterium]|jgi:predicted dehydrogenase|nr:oxidoreductase [Gemmatimonadaceae bacterium]MDP6018483.1 Gfo/Idh/MocA family oxidoreductase [Candidatus Latescibacterota bacterium]HJP29594.1 Gfo/Idh/MocA family oxidoreductase [Candidatus Latescibacterota bacterium]